MRRRAFLAGSISGWTLLHAQEQQPPFAPPASVRIERDVVYASPGGRDLHCDLFRPRSGGGPRPAILFIHGGGWRAGSRTQFQRQAAHMAAKGFVCACLEYRLSPEAKWPVQIDDCKAAVRWFWENQYRYGVDPRRIGAAGGSAGGHLAALLGVTSRWDSFGAHLENPGPDSDVAAVAAFNGAFDLVDLAENGGDNPRGAVAQLIGAPLEEAREKYLNASPLHHAGKAAPPFLLLHGTDDETVPYSQAEAMQRKLEAAGIEVELFTADGAEHGFFNSPPWFEPTLDAMERFFVRTLKA